MPYKVVIFDLDGTLLDTLVDLAAAVNYALRLRGLPVHRLEDYRGMVGHGVRNLMKAALEQSLAGLSGDEETPGQAGGDGRPGDDLIDAALADFKAWYTAHIDVYTRPYPGMQELLNKLNGKGIALTIASNKFQSGTERLVAEFFPGIPFVAILGNREGFPLKPDPQIVQEVLQKADARPDQAAMVGDSRTDMQTAANGGIRGIAVTWGYRTLPPCGDESGSSEPGGGARSEAQTGHQAPLNYRLVSSARELELALLED